MNEQEKFEKLFRKYPHPVKGFSEKPAPDAPQLSESGRRRRDGFVAGVEVCLPPRS